jgi:hypothetical protein
MFPDEIYQGGTLPGPEERQRILEHAGLIVAEARALLKRLDQARDAGQIIPLLPVSHLPHPGTQPVAASCSIGR